MTRIDANLVRRLHEAGNPREKKEWYRHKGYYVATCRVSADDVPGLIEIVRKWGGSGLVSRRGRGARG